MIFPYMSLYVVLFMCTYISGVTLKMWILRCRTMISSHSQPWQSVIRTSSGQHGAGGGGKVSRRSSGRCGEKGGQGRRLPFTVVSSCNQSFCGSGRGLPSVKVIIGWVTREEERTGLRGVRDNNMLFLNYLRWGGWSGQIWKMGEVGRGRVMDWVGDRWLAKAWRIYDWVQHILQECLLH